MGGKVKQSQRSKNNTRPSNSGRSAELLGSTIPSFVGFTAHSDLGIVPLAPGFAISENLPDQFDASIASQFQLIFRKMSKKDPVTKAKALQEFIEIINDSNLDEIKTILPLWPKFYCNLANDVDHRVREIVQQALSAIIDKTGKSIAPYLKQLGPVWIASQFDNYAPAASLALTTFRTSFAPHKIQEVYGFCQNEIIDYISKNLLFHTASTINSAKIHTPEEAENKYNRIVKCSLKMFSIYLEKINSEKLKEVEDKINDILQNTKFWNFGKHKDPSIKSAWFELLYIMLQNNPSFLEPNKQQIIQIVFQNIDDTNPLVISHIWGCVLLIQTTYDDWYTYLNFKKAIQPKLFSLIKNSRNCASAFYPNLFPFISKLSDESLQNLSLKEFYVDLFNNVKQSILDLNQSDSRSNIQAITTSLFECLLYVIQKENNKSDYDLNYYENLINLYVLKVIDHCVVHDTVAMKAIFLHISKLIAFLSKNCNKFELCSKLFNKFWIELNKIIKNISENIENNSNEMNRCLELVQNLYTNSENHSNSSNNKVKFTSSDDDDSRDKSEKEVIPITKQKSKTSDQKILNELRTIAIQLGHTYVEKISKKKNTREFISQLKALIQMFGHEEFFYLRVTDAKDLKSVFEIIMNFLENDCPESESMLDIVFEILSLLEKSDRIEIIENILKIPDSIIQKWIINRLLSYPLCTEPEIRKILSKDYVSEIIINFAKDFIKDNSKDKFNLLHKCFFQIDSGEILINQNTIENIVRIMSEPLNLHSNIICNQEIENENDDDQQDEEHEQHNNLNDLIDTCGSFIAQIMPIICSNSTNKNLQNDIFLKLFKFSVEMIKENDYLSEDTLWEIITCWQDALSSGDIKIYDNENDELINNCSEIIENRLISKNYNNENDYDLITQDIVCISEFTAKLITCSLESIPDENERIKILDKLLTVLLGKENLKYNEICKNLNILCSHYQLITGIYTNMSNEEYKVIDISSVDILNYFRIEYYKFNVIFKLICNIKTDKEKISNKKITTLVNNRTNENENINGNFVAANNNADADDDDDYEVGGDDDDDEDEERECTDDYIDPNEQVLKIWSNLVYEYFISSMKVAALGESFIMDTNLLNYETQLLLINLSEKVKLALENLPELFTITLKEKIFSNISSNDISTIRILNLLLSLNQYSKDENGPILLYEDAGIRVFENRDFNSYLNITQIMLNKFPEKCLPNNSLILNNDNIDIIIRFGYLRCLITNKFLNCQYNEVSDKQIISECLKLFEEINTKKANNEISFSYNVDISKQDSQKVYFDCEFMYFVREVLNHFGNQLSLKSWDTIRISLSSWVLSISKSLDQWYNYKVSIFICSVYALFESFSRFIQIEKMKSSTEQMTNIIDEWENVFALEVNLILFKTYVYLVTNKTDQVLLNRMCILDAIARSIEYLEYKTILKAAQTTFMYKVDDIIKFCLENLSNDIHSVQITSLYIIQKLIPYLVSIDIDNLRERIDSTENNVEEGIIQSDNWHLIQKFIPFLEKYQNNIEKYLPDFSYKLTDLTNLPPIKRNDAITYFYIWDCVLLICSKSPSELRSFYALTITKNKFEQNLLNFIFRSMPIEILKNHDSKIMNSEMFTKLDWDKLKDRFIETERLACYTYTQMLRYLPAVVRKWWNSTNTRQKTFIDKLTTNFVSNLICNEELRAVSKHEKHENMQVTVHTSTREVIAVYSIDEARIGLNITLAPNHPLGPVKVENTKPIGNRAQSRIVGMQLTIFLTHQNGSIYDGLSLWKTDLDKKFEGVEECCICYTVIHQDTCRLPKLSCKTCKKKYHGPCLYKWFTTSSKSTCPICRNVF